MLSNMTNFSPLRIYHPNCARTLKWDLCGRRMLAYLCSVPIHVSYSNHGAGARKRQARRTYFKRDSFMAVTRKSGAAHASSPYHPSPIAAHRPSTPTFIMGTPHPGKKAPPPPMPQIPLPPSIPDGAPESIRASYNLFENEDGSDVILMVGDDSYRERVPAHSWVLAASNPYFRALFQGPLADRHKTTYDIHNDPKGFQNLLKWLYRHECAIQSMDSALITLQVAIQYLCPELAEQCVEYIGKHLRVSNVLKVLQFTLPYCPASQIPESSVISTAPSAPSLEALEEAAHADTRPFVAVDRPKPLEVSQHTVHNMTQLQELSEEAEFQDPTACCSDLFNVCLEVVDRATQSVLSSETLEELDHRTLQIILRRSTLNVPNELPIFQAVQRWSTAECKRRMLPLTSENRRRVLGSLLYHVRFLNMTSEQLQQTTSLLTADEFNYLATRISGHTPASEPVTLHSHLAMMAEVRRHSPAGLPKPDTPSKSKKKNSTGKRKYTKKELMLDVVSCLAVIFD